MPQSYSLHVHSVSGIQWRKKWLKVPPKLGVAIDVDGAPMAQTHRKRDFVPMWNSRLLLSAAGTESLIRLHLVRHHTAGNPENMWIRMARNASSSGSDLKNILDVPIPLKPVGKDLKPTPGLALIIRLARIGCDQAIESAIADAAKDTAKLGSGTSSDRNKVADFALQHSDSDLVSSLGDLLESLTASLDVVIKIGGVIAKIHPFAELGYNILTSVYQAVKKQQNTDQSIVKLVRMMVDVYSFTKDVKSLPEIEHIEGVISAIVKETAGCALFIREYTGHRFIGKYFSNSLLQFC
ncbi:hypothetical protein B0H14DRAFT_2613621 [Mycena olivaceomarginata]|nr:hypothetical protein B0H14DRAFT_2613621 [Mycena olivaceomarginata]